MAVDYSATPSPCFVIDELRLRDNLERLAQVQRDAGVKIICALKGFAAYGTFPLLRRYLPGVTASSLSEARLGQEEFGSEVHAYCPAYIPGDFDAMASIAKHVTFNSVGEYQRYRPRLGGSSPGLRINPQYAEVEVDMYNPCAPGSRLGVTADELGGALPEGIEGLHFHSLCENGADALERTLVEVERRFGPLLDQVRWLNMGGGHALTRADYDVAHLARLVGELRARHPSIEQVILEPGSAVGYRTGELVGTVLDILESGGVRTAMLDVSFATHMPDCLEMPYRPEVLGAHTDSPGDTVDDTPNDTPGHRYHLGGQSCLAGDFMADYVFDSPLQVGDRVVFTDMIHYTMVKTTTFNGIGLPSIAVAREGGELEVLKNFGYEDYRRRL